MSALSLRIGRGASRLPADIALSLIPSLPRATLERLAQRIIEHLDEEDGDPDFENATDAEDDFNLTGSALRCAGGGPGCEVSDPFGQSDEDGIDSGAADFVLHGVTYHGAGCPIADYDLCAIHSGHNVGDEA
jgi:hypothetical protein